MIDLKFPRQPHNIVATAKIAEPRQQRALSGIIYFFLAILALTLIARGTSSAAMPTVDSVSPYQGTVSQTFTVQGTIQSEIGTPFLSPENIMVETVPCKAGQRVQSGEVIATFSSADVELAISTQSAALNQLCLQQKQLNEGESADSYALSQAQEKLNRAYASYSSTDAAGQQSIADAQSAYDDALQSLQDIRSQEPQNARPEQSTPEQAQAETEYSKWEQRISTAESTLKQAESSLAAAKSAAAGKLDAALSSAQSAEDSRNDALHSYQKEAEDLQDTNATDAASAIVLTPQITDIKSKLASLTQIRDNNYSLCTPSAGVLTAVYLEAGQSSPAVAGLLCAADAGNQFVAQLDEAQAKSITVGATVQIQQQSAVQGTVTEITPENVLTATLQGTEMSAGTAVLNYTKQGGETGLCIPLSCIGTDSNGSFVYLIEEKNTVLGLQNVLTKLPVTVIEKGDALARVEGALSQDDKLAANSSKPLYAGAKVLVNEK